MAEGKIDEQVILIGGSAGSLEALLEILPLLDSGLQTPIIVVMHRKASNDPVLVELLSVKTQLKVKEVEDKEPINKGYLYIAPGDYHILFEKDHTMSLDDSEKVNFSRPSIDVAFQSAADIYGPGLTCILLSGANADGTAGFKYAKEKGSITIAQQPETAEVAFMPQSAINNDTASRVYNMQEIAMYINSAQRYRAE